MEGVGLLALHPYLRTPARAERGWVHHMSQNVTSQRD